LKDTLAKLFWSNIVKTPFKGSDNEEINTILRYSQTHILDSRQILEYIPFTSFNIVDKIGEGGFGQVFKARWTNGGVITGWNEDTKSWERIPPSSFVVLKSCNSWEIFINEVGYNFNGEQNFCVRNTH